MFLIMENYYDESRPHSLWEDQETAFTKLRKLNGRPWERDASHGFSLIHIDVNSNKSLLFEFPEIYYDIGSRRFYSYFNNVYGDPYKFKTYQEYLSRIQFHKVLLKLEKK